MRHGTYRLVAHRLPPAKDFAPVIFISGPRSIFCPALSPPPVVLYPDSKFFQGCRSYWHCLSIISVLTRSQSVASLELVGVHFLFLCGSTGFPPRCPFSGFLFHNPTICFRPNYPCLAPPPWIPTVGVILDRPADAVMEATEAKGFLIEFPI